MLALVAADQLDDARDLAAAAERHPDLDESDDGDLGDLDRVHVWQAIAPLFRQAAHGAAIYESEQDQAGEDDA